MAIDGLNDGEDDQYYSTESPSDDSPILSYRYGKHRYTQYTSPAPPEEREKRSTFSVLSKVCIFCAAMILFRVLMYIPIYNKASYHIPRGIAGWSIHTSRDTKLYVQPNNVTIIHEPREVCSPSSTNNKLFLLIVVCSSIENFETRTAIRETWGNYENYKKTLKIFKLIREKYKSYDFKKDLYPIITEMNLNNVTNDNSSFDSATENRGKRDVSLHELLPALAKVLNMTVAKTDDVQEKRFDDEDDGPVLPQFDMNKEIGGQTDAEIIDYENYDYQSNIMRIPPKGEEEDTNQDLSKILAILKQSKDFDKIKENLLEPDNTEFKLVFLLGLPSKDNKTLQKKIDREVSKYGDIIQEGFIDSYNNLTLKSIMMLKWVTKKCSNNVRYILKSDDDTYINVPNLMLDLRNRSDDFDKKNQEGNKKEYLLIGDLIIGARPVLLANDKWYSPKYMYAGRVYPRYLSGTGYAMSLPAAQALYTAALTTHIFHLEDIYITGMCSLRAQPRIVPRDDPLFSYVPLHPTSALCFAHSHVSVHRVKPSDIRMLHQRLLVTSEVDRCERIRLTQVRRERIRRAKIKAKKPLTHISNAI